MNNKTLYILSVGIAFFAGMKLTKKTVVIKEVVKEVKTKCEGSDTILNIRDRLNTCKEEYDKLVIDTNTEVEKLESTIDACEARYYTDKDVEKEINKNNYGTCDFLDNDSNCKDVTNEGY